MTSHCLSNEDKLFDAREHIPEIIAYCVNFPPWRRTKDANDVFCGEGMFAKACEEHDIDCTKFDIIVDPAQNILKRGGLFLALDDALSVRVLGLGVLGPDCRWQKSHRRTNANPLGEEGHPRNGERVERSNLISVNSTLLCLVYENRGVFAVVVQPWDSRYFKSPWQVAMFEDIGWFGTSTCMRFPGCQCAKPNVSSLGLYSDADIVGFLKSGAVHLGGSLVELKLISS